MKVAIVGAGPAGLYLSYLLKRRRPDIDVRVLEQNAPEASFGFGLVFSDRALEFLQEDDPETYELITPAMETWNDIAVDLEGEKVVIDGIGFAGIGRLELLQLLQARTRAAGMEVQYERPVTSLDELSDADLVVGADGVNSIVRRAHEQAFGASLTYLTNKFAWYGTPRRFEHLTQTFRRNAHGVFNAHHYPHSAQMSTFVTETDVATWKRAGFATMDPEATRVYLENVFADVLQGAPLVSNKSVWRNFPKVRNERWSAANTVLLGDALHTAHFSIGSGTRLAMEDAIALVEALDRHFGDIPAAVRAYETERRPILDKLAAAADASGEWYERFGEHMKLPPMAFAMSYITRSGRVDLERLRRVSPRFVGAYERFLKTNSH